MNTARTPLPYSVRALPVCLVFVLIGLFSLWLALTGLLPPMRAMLGHAPLVALSPRDAIGLPIAFGFFAFAAMSLFPPSDTGPARKRLTATDRRQSRGLTLFLGVAIASVLLTVISVPLTEIATSAVMANRGYERCSVIAGERHPPMRWNLPGAHCP